MSKRNITLTGILCLALGIILGAGGYALFSDTITYERTDIAQPAEKAPEEGSQAIHINVNDLAISPLYRKTQKLADALKQSGTETRLGGKEDFTSGDFNLYIARDTKSLPEVLDKKAINILWLPMFSGAEDPALLRAFDVIVVKSMAAFNHLKAINVRTAYIPEAIDIKKSRFKRKPESRAMFYGDNTGFVLPLYLAGRQNMSLDIYGKGFAGAWPAEELKGDYPDPAGFSRYAAVLIDQSEEEIRDELINPKIIEVIENGGLPYIRFNSGVYKIFGEALPMYHSEQEFIDGMRDLLQNPAKGQHIRAELQKKAAQWNSLSQAEKFKEIFRLMENKRR